MYATTTAPSIQVMIGPQTRVYHAFVTTAPAALDAPATVTLYTSTIADVAGLAVNPDVFPNEPAMAVGRLVLVDATELAWQRARYREARHAFAPADPVLLNRNALQLWLWNRLTAPTTELARKTA